MLKQVICKPRSIMGNACSAEEHHHDSAEDRHRDSADERRSSACAHHDAPPQQREQNRDGRRVVQVFSSDYIVPEGEPLLLHFRSDFSWSGEDYTIVDARSRDLWFRVDGKLFSIEKKKTLFDDEGIPVFLMKEKVQLVDDKQTVLSADGRELFEVASNYGNTAQSATVTDVFGNRLLVSMRAAFTGENGAMFVGSPSDGGRPFATFHCPAEMDDFNGSEWTSADFFVRVFPGADVALVAAMILAYKEMNDTYIENSNRGVAEEAPVIDNNDDEYCGEGENGEEEQEDNNKDA